MNNIKCIINTPLSQFVSKEGDMIVLPSQQGELGILFNHMPLISELTSGKVKIYNGSEVIEEINIEGGIAYIKADVVEIFTS
jgi:F-type H+-transporting ATPase subunit epsilon